jgi:hypothetical protein
MPWFSAHVSWAQILHEPHMIQSSCGLSSSRVLNRFLQNLRGVWSSAIDFCADWRTHISALYLPIILPGFFQCLPSDSVLILHTSAYCRNRRTFSTGFSTVCSLLLTVLVASYSILRLLSSIVCLLWLRAPAFYSSLLRRGVTLDLLFLSLAFLVSFTSFNQIYQKHQPKINIGYVKQGVH